MESIKAQGQDYIFDSKVLTPPRLGWIYQVCAKNSQVVELIKEYPIGTIPTILNTMKTFRADFIRKKKDMQNSWRQDCIKHWSKSLDHKNFYFRQNEKKTQLIKEFLNQMKKKIERSQLIKNLERQKENLNFYTGFEGEDVQHLNLTVNPDIDPSHPMLLEDPLYYKHFEKLPQFRFLINDTQNLKLLLKYLFVYIDSQSGQSHKQKDFLISFSKYFLNLGFVKKGLENLKIIEFPEETPELIKNSHEFYK